MKLGKREIAQLKRTAQNVAPLVTKKHKIQEKIIQLSYEYDAIKEQIEAWETATKAMTGGYTTEDLVDRVIENNTTKYILKYPDTIIPPKETALPLSSVVDSMPTENENTEEALLVDMSDNTI